MNTFAFRLPYPSAASRLLLVTALIVSTACAAPLPLEFRAKPVEIGFNFLNPTLVNLDRDGIQDWVITRFKGTAGIERLDGNSLVPALPQEGPVIRLFCDSRSSFAINRNVTKWE